MKEILHRLIKGEILSQEESKGVLGRILAGEVNSTQVAAYLAVMATRPLEPSELAGFCEAVYERARLIDLSDFDPLEVCGTGGDGKETFNISTLAALVVAGAGGVVAKHGNYGFSGSCGSSNVLEALGVRFPNTREEVMRCLEASQVCFLHAPVFHPALGQLASVRKELGVRTFLNLLGPLVNPARPRSMLIGVPNEEIRSLYRRYLSETDRRFTIVESDDGYDEISLTGGWCVTDREGTRRFVPEELGLVQVSPTDLLGGQKVSEFVSVFLRILEGAGTLAQQQVVVVNAAFALRAKEPGRAIQECLERAKESLESGAALRCFKRLVEVTTRG